MENELNIYTGSLKYRDVIFTFVFDSNELRLIPPADMKETIRMEWIMTPLANGVYTMGDPPTMDEPFLIGQCNETGNTIIFLTKQGSSIGSRNSVLFVGVVAYIVCKYHRDSVDKITFTSPEIDCIHPVNEAFTFSFDREQVSHTGVFTVTTRDFEGTTTDPQHFVVDDTDVSVKFGVSRKLSTKIGTAPISLNSSMIFEFEPTADYRFILRLWYVAKQFIQFLCYRKNVYLPEIALSAPFGNGRHEEFARMHILDESVEYEPEVLKKGEYIRQSYIQGSEGAILSDIAAGTLYLRHLPDTHKAGNRIDAARFVMITAAFEWEFHRAYEDGVPKSEATVKAENTASSTLQGLIESSTGKLKQIYKFLKRLIKSDSLQSEIIHIGKIYGPIIDVFGHRLYKINGEELIYADMGKRLSSQRNHYAHGDLDQEFIGLSLLDLLYLERVIYAMQLKHYAVNEKDIQKAINDLFHCSIAIE